jgi:hypothetical protein
VDFIEILGIIGSNVDTPSTRIQCPNQSAQPDFTSEEPTLAMAFLGPRIWEVDVISIDSAFSNIAINKVSGITPDKANPRGVFS